MENKEDHGGNGIYIMKRILIVEDDRKLNDGIKLTLRKEYACAQAYSLTSVRADYNVQQFDLVILDVNFPDGDGFDYLKEIRKVSCVPVILLTANNMDMDIVAGLELGANDYITKPFSLIVLRARVGVQLRGKEGQDEVYKEGDFYFNFYKMEFLFQGLPLELSKTEQRILRCLVEHKGRNVGRSLLIDETWPGESEYVDEHALTVAMNRLRKKLKDVTGGQEYIKTVYGIGYLWMFE